MGKGWKDRLGVVYSTKSDYEYNHNAEDEQETLSSDQQKQTVSLNRKKQNAGLAEQQRTERYLS